MPQSTPARLLPALLALAAITSCGSTEPSGLHAPELLVRTDKAVYSKAVNEPVKTTVINSGANMVYFLMGDYVYIEQASDNGWIYRGPWFFIDGYGLSFPLAPGDSMEVLPMDMGYIGRAGVYRFVFQVSADRLMRGMLPKEERISEPFTVTW
jgi:hypothetical protein